MSLKETDKAAAAIAVAPRVALADIEAAIAAKFYWTAGSALAAKGQGSADWMAPDVEVPMVLRQMDILTVCVLVVRNGFTVIGKSAPASPENFNADLGRKFAYEDCIRQLWPLMGYALRDKLHNEPDLGKN